MVPHHPAPVVGRWGSIPPRRRTRRPTVPAGDVAAPAARFSGVRSHAAGASVFGAGSVAGRWIGSPRGRPGPAVSSSGSSSWRTRSSCSGPSRPWPASTLTVDVGEIILLRGPNGAGKTTLLRVCAGLVPLARGRGTILGRRPGHSTVTRSARRVGLLGHRNGLYLDLSVAENIHFWGATVGASDDEIAAAMDRLGLSGRLAVLPVRRLSAGQQRRTALACLVARRAQLWLLDEPHAGLDAAGRDELDATLRQAAASGATVMVASHELERAGSAGHPHGRRRRRPGDRGGRHERSLRTALLVAGKDLRIEWRSRIGAEPGAPVRGDRDGAVHVRARPFPAPPGTDDTLLESVAPGLVWLATLFSLLLLVQRTFAIESEDGALDALRAAGVDAAALFWGKTAALAAQLAVLEALLLLTAIFLYGTRGPSLGRGVARHDMARRDRRAGRGRYALRRPRCRRTGAGDPSPAADAPGGGARSDRSHTSGRSSARHRRDGDRRTVGPGSASSRCSPSPSAPGERWPSVPSSTSRRRPVTSETASGSRPTTPGAASTPGVP